VQGPQLGQANRQWCVGSLPVRQGELFVGCKRSAFLTVFGSTTVSERDVFLQYPYLFDLGIVFFCALQGDPCHWLACAIYVACRNVTEHAVGDSDTLIEGNLVSLTRLLRLCNIR